jgi:hypothetical protein
LKKIVAIQIASVAVVLTLVMIMIFQVKFEVASKPIGCVAPYTWIVCSDWTFRGPVLTWGAEKDENFISLVIMEDWHMMWNGTAYDREINKAIMFQSSLFGHESYGNCVGWYGYCYDLNEYADTVTP